MPFKPEPTKSSVPFSAVPAVPLNPEPGKPSESPIQKVAALMDSDPRQASELLKSMVQADPRNIQLEGNYLAALYRCRNIVDFERGLSRALSSGVTVKSMLEVPPFKRALSDESRLRKTNKAAALLPDEVMERILAGL